MRLKLDFKGYPCQVCFKDQGSWFLNSLASLKQFCFAYLSVHFYGEMFELYPGILQTFGLVKWGHVLIGVTFLSECKTIPELYFFDVVGQTNAIIHLFEKQFSDSIIPLVRFLFHEWSDWANKQMYRPLRQNFNKEDK